MVLKKRIYYGGFHGLLAPVIPKAPRSLRRRSLHNKPSERGEICAFELLAAVAGKLLQESESSTSSILSEGKEQISVPKEVVKREPFEVKVKPVKSEHHEQGSCSEGELVIQPTNLKLKLEPHLKGLPHSDNESGLERTSIIRASDFTKEDSTSLRSVASEDKNATGEAPSKPEGGSPSYGKLCDIKVDDNNTVEVQTEATKEQGGALTADKPYILKNQVANKSVNSVHLSFYKDLVPSACFPRRRDNVTIAIRDDDEKYFRYNNRNTRRRAFGSRSHAGYRRLRKMLNSKYRKVAPKLKDFELANTMSGGLRSFYHKRKNIYMREQYQADASSKRRKSFHSKRLYDKEASCESISNSPDKGAGGDKRRPATAFNRGLPSSVISRKCAFPSQDSHVRFSIKSFKVPELSIEVPETATIGSLKRSVMEAVTSILQSKLHVGILLQGKKVRDDNRTLQQTGISQNCNLETLGFTLEPTLPEASPSLIPKETPLLLPCNNHQQPSRSFSSPTAEMGFSDSSLDHSPPVIIDNLTEKNEESITFSAEVLMEDREADSKALVIVPALEAEVLSVVPLSEKPTKRYELPQRRTRRPFSVSEVEALVEAVETLGAGRWRDVKMRAFDDANHRTYVDLKDKWKTLVHTASISPQQRRGEPVPQDLLDRVLAAHAYWSQHQPNKQNAKNQKTVEAPM